MSIDTQLPLLLTPAEAGQALHVARSTVYLMMGRGELHGLKIGAATRIARSEVEDWITRRLNGEVTA